MFDPVLAAMLETEAKQPDLHPLTKALLNQAAARLKDPRPTWLAVDDKERPAPKGQRTNILYGTGVALVGKVDKHTIAWHPLADSPGSVLRAKTDWYLGYYGRN